MKRSSLIVRQRHGFTLVEILVVVTLVVVLSLIGSINVLRSRMTGHETVTIANLRQLAVALQMYNSTNNAYPDPLGLLSDATPPFATSSLTGGSGQNGNSDLHGYRYVYTKEGNFDYTVVVDPTAPGVTGSRSFFVDETGIIRHCIGTGATVSDPTIEQAPIAC